MTNDTSNPAGINKFLQNNSFVSQLVKDGEALLENSEKPNIITFAQFEPFIPLFNMDRERYLSEEPSGPYFLEMNALYNRYMRTLSINRFQPTIVIRSKEDPTELYFLDRQFTRIKSDILDGDVKSERDSVPAAISKASGTTRDSLLMEASVRDVLAANSTPEMKKQFAMDKVGSALINKRFVERNLSPEKRAELMKDQAESTQPTSSVVSTTTLLDDDD